VNVIEFIRTANSQLQTIKYVRAFAGVLVRSEAYFWGHWLNRRRYQNDVKFSSRSFQFQRQQCYFQL